MSNNSNHYSWLQLTTIIILLSAAKATLSAKARIIERPDDDALIRYAPTWSSLDTRPLPQWYDQAKVGIFIHWGVFSVPSFGSEWFWKEWKAGQQQKYVDFMKANYPPNFSYQEFARDFTAEFFDPDEWADLFAKSGAKYVVLTSKHHEGFTLWPSQYSFGWNAQDIGPNRDLVGDLARAVRAKNLQFGLYHSLYEWFNPMYLADQAALFLRNDFVARKIMPEMHELVERYNPAVIWSDGDWEAPDAYWNSTEFLAWLYNDSPVKDTVVVNDRWGMGIPCEHGDFYCCKDRYNPGVVQKHKWENAMTIDKYSWGYRRNAALSDYLTTHELIVTLAQTISCGGNLLINIGPTRDGIIAPIFQERLLDLGKWLATNGEAIYASRPWTVQNDTRTAGVWYTSSSSAAATRAAASPPVYGIVLNWPIKNILELQAPWNIFNVSSSAQPSVNLLGFAGKLKWELGTNKTVRIHFPDKSTVDSYGGGGAGAWVVKIYTT